MKKDRNERSAFLKQLSTSQLEKILRKDIDFDGTDNQDMIFEILSILKDRDQGKSPETDAAWQEFKEHYNISDGEGMSLYPTAETTAKKKGKKHIGLRKLAVAAAAVLVLVCALPPALGAVNIIELIAQWTNEEFTFMNSEREPREEYEFIYSTDNPDLQEIHDAVQELGVTENVVPSWIPDGFEMIEFDISDLYAYDHLSTFFKNESGDTIKFTATIYSNREAMGGSNYEKDETEVEIIELNDTTYYIMSNIDKWVAVWEKDNVECMIGTSLEKEELIKIIYSIYEEEV